jgi:cell division protein FtsA
MKKQKNATVTVVDIGNTKIVCLIATTNLHNQLQIGGIGHNISHGIKAGRITDIKAAEKSIIQAISAAERMAGQSVQKIYVNISSNNLLSQRVATDLMVTGHEINDKDINRLLFQTIEKFSDQDLEVIHSFAYDYVLDGNRGIENPLGMYGNNLSADFHVLFTSANHLMNMNSCFAHCQLDIDGVISAAYSSGLACLTQDEMELGVTLLEFGGGCTSVSIFSKGHLLFTDALPIGGIHVTNDIARCISTDFVSAERIKTLYGTAIMTSADFDEQIEVSTASLDSAETTIISKSELVEIIRARIEEILDIIKKKIEASGLDKFSGNKIVITGGGSQLAGMKEIINHIFSKNVRIGYPQKIEGLAESTSGVAFSSSIGMLLHVLNASNHKMFSQAPANDSTPLASMIQWLKENFS